MFILIGQIILGLTLLVLGGESLVRGSVNVAKKLGISTLVIGLTIIAYGTSAPELIVTVNAVLANHYDIAVGNILGSNISNILLVLGTATIIYPIQSNLKTAKQEGILLLSLTFIFSFVAYFYKISFIVALLFLAILTIYTFFLLKSASKDKALQKELEAEVNPDEQKKQNLGISLLFILAGFVLLFFGADILVENAVELAKLLNIEEGVIAVTIVAFGSSAPEFFASIVSAYRKQSDLVIGNILGSCIFNIAGVICVSGMIDSFTVSDKFLGKDIYFFMISAVLMVLAMFLAKNIGKVIGLCFVSLYATYIYLQWI